MQKDNHPSQDQVKDLFMYDPLVGDFVRRVRRGGNGPVGSVAGSKHPHGYTQIKISGRLYLAHRLAWLYVTGAWPGNNIDHINGQKSDNRLINLRDVPQSLNMQNQRTARSRSSSGLLGASWDSRRSNWASSIEVDGKTKRLGRYATSSEAHEAYLIAKRLLHQGCTI